MSEQDLSDIVSQRPAVESLKERAERYLRMFELDREKREKLIEGLSIDANFCRDYHKGRSERKGDMYMLDTCVSGGPTGEETGVHYAVDFGGTNIRCVRVELFGHGQYEVDSVSKNIMDIPTRENLPRGLMDKRATATELFDNIALIVLEMMHKYKDDQNGTFYKVGFTFSFACKQLGLNKAEAQRMGKGFETGIETNDPIVQPGTDIVLLLNKAFLRNSVPAEAVVVLNDTTGTLISGAYLRPPNYPEALIGVILGTGMNLCYVDPEAQSYGYKGAVINTEAGALRKGLPRNVVDHEVDDAAPPLSSQCCEKMVSGLYLPEICRRLILKVFQHKAPPLAWVHKSMTTREIMRIAYETDPELSHTKAVLETQLEWPADELTPEVLEIAHKLCRAACRRSAGIMACIIAGFARKTGRLQPAVGGLTVAIDGSVYKKNKEYQKDLREELNTLLGDELASLIYISVADDGSGLGAAILAASPATAQKKDGSFAPSPIELWHQKQMSMESSA